MSSSSTSNDANVQNTYQRVALDEATAAETTADSTSLPNTIGARRTLSNFVAMSALFSANHGCVVSCLALASSRLGTTGAWQSGILMIAYAASSLLGATYAVKTLGPRNSLILGMGSYCLYVGCFYVATILGDEHANQQAIAAYLGATLGGIGAGVLWTGQGTYFGLASQEYSSQLQIPVAESNAKLAGYHAFLYLAEELVMRMLSSVLLEFEIASWEAIFGIYTLVAVGSTLAMPFIYDYRKADPEEENASAFRKATVAAELLLNDPKMKHMIGFNALFGFASAFLNSYVNGQVLPVALDDPDSKYVGLLASTVSVVAAMASLLFGKFGSNERNNSIILVLGALSFGGVVLPFLFQPDASRYGWVAIVGVYCLHGIGRATFEGAWRSTFADYFSSEKEGAFANIILQNGVASGIGYILTFALICDEPSKYCIEYSNGTLHDVWTFEFVTLMSMVLAIGGYLRASYLHRTRAAQSSQDDENEMLQRNENGISA